MRFGKIKEKEYKNIFFKYIPLTTTRSIEVEASRGSRDMVSMDLCIKFRGSDHAGPYFNITVMGYSMGISMPDSRHWNRKTNDWNTDQEQWWETANYFLNEIDENHDLEFSDLEEYYDEGLSPQAAVQRYFIEYD